MYSKKLQIYKTDNLESELMVADPHRVIQLMMQNLLERLAQAKGAISRKDYAAKAELISKSTALLNGLQDSLDLSQGEVAENLYSLYTYMKDRLWVASVDLDMELIDEVANLIITIKSAWDQIPEAEKQKGFEKRQQLGDLK